VETDDAVAIGARVRMIRRGPENLGVAHSDAATMQAA
jgi:hypothetical protein